MGEIGDKEKDGICVGYDPTSKDNVPDVDVVKVCLFSKDSENKTVFFITREEATLMGFGFLQAAFMGLILEKSNEPKIKKTFEKWGIKIERRDTEREG